MFKVRTVMLALVAVFVVSAASATVALAQEGPQWKVNGKQLTSRNETRALKDKNQTGTVAKLSSKIGGAAVVIVCKTVASSGIIIGGNPGLNREEIKFTECEVEGQPKCVVEEPIIVKAKSILAHVVGSSKMLVEFSPETGSTFTTIKITGTGCLAKVTANVTLATGASFGVACEVVKEEEEVEVGELHCPTTAI